MGESCSLEGGGHELLDPKDGALSRHLELACIVGRWIVSERFITDYCPDQRKMGVSWGMETSLVAHCPWGVARRTRRHRDEASTACIVTTRKRDQRSGSSNVPREDQCGRMIRELLPLRSVATA